MSDESKAAISAKRLIPVNVETGDDKTILICGDCGPARDVLLARRDVQVFWADSIRAARSTIRVSQPAVCLTRPVLADGPALRLLGGGHEPNLPIVALIDADNWALRNEYFDAGAHEVLEVEDTDSVLKLITQLTGLQFAKSRRVRIECDATVHQGGSNQKYTARLRDLSATGLALTGLDEQARNSLLRIRFDVDDTPLELWARVRHSRGGPGGFTGVQFVGLSRQERLALTSLVSKHDTAQTSSTELLSSMLSAMQKREDSGAEAGDRPQINASKVSIGGAVEEGPKGRAASVLDWIQDPESNDPSTRAERARMALKELRQLSKQDQDAEADADVSRTRAELLRTCMDWDLRGGRPGST